MKIMFPMFENEFWEYLEIMSLISRQETIKYSLIYLYDFPPEYNPS